MATLNPQTSNVPFEQPVQPPGSGGVLAGLSNLLPTSRAPAPSSASLENDASIKFYNEVDRARTALAQGKISREQANSIVGNAYQGYARDYGPENEDINNTFTNFTGQSSNYALTGQAIDYAALSEREDFITSVAYVRSQNPDMGQQEIFQEAYAHLTDKLASEEKIAKYERSNKTNWIDARPDYEAHMIQVGQDLRGIIAMANRDSVLTPEEAEEIRTFYDNKVNGLIKPMGVDQAEWDNFQEEYVNNLNSLVGNFLDLSQKNGVNADIARAMNDILGKMMQQGKLPPALALKINNPEGDAGVFMDLLRQVANTNDPNGPEWLEAYTKFQTSVSLDELVEYVTTFDEATTLDPLRTRVDTASFTEANSAEKRRQITTPIKFTTPGQTAVDLLGRLENLKSMDQTALNPGDYQKMFGPSFYDALTKVYDANPLVGQELIDDARRVMSENIAKMVTSYNSEITQNGFEIIDGKLQPTNMPASAQAWVDQWFGGDWQKALDAKGINSGGAGNAAIFGRVKNYEDLRRRAIQIENAGKQKGQLDERFPDAVKPTVFTSPVNSGTLTGLIDRTEGAGNYDTLFGHSQNGVFAGVNVSEMTIGELASFSDPNGPYGQWVKSNNPEGVVATPMGRYQFVGSTMLETAQAMGLSLNTVFTPEIQDAMFLWKAKQRLGNASTMEGKRAQLRAEWAGLRGVSDSMLDQAIYEIDNTAVPNYRAVERETNSMFTNAPEASPFPLARPGGAPTESVIPVARPGTQLRETNVPITEPVSPVPNDDNTKTASEFTTEEENDRAFIETVRQEFDLKEYTSFEEALADGVQLGDMILLNGEVYIFGS